MRVCRFEMQLKGQKRFYCAAKYGPNGWAYLWAHDGLHEPCEGCPFKIEGEPLTINGELKPAEWMEMAGKHIRARDWREFERRGISPKKASAPAANKRAWRQSGCTRNGRHPTACDEERTF